jgi:hypothetical protein
VRLPLLIAWITLGPLPASAQCVLEGAPSRARVERCTDGNLITWVVHAALDRSDVGLAVTAPAARGRTAEEWAGSVVGAQVVFSAGDFDLTGFSPRGFTIGEGESWPDTTDDARLSVIAFDSDGAGAFSPAREIVPAESWMWNAISGVTVLEAGTPIPGCAGDGCVRGPRTGVGLSENRRELVAVVAAGFDGASPGVTDHELGQLLANAGAYDAIRTAFGSPSALYLPGVGLFGANEAASRPAAAHMAVVDRGMAPARTLQGIVVDADNNRIQNAHVRLVNSVGDTVYEDTIETNGYWMTSRPLGTYTIFVDAAGWVSTCRECDVTLEEFWCSVRMERTGTAPVCELSPWGMRDVGPWPTSTVDAAVSDAGVTLPSRLPLAGEGGCSVGPQDGSFPAMLVVLLALRGRHRERERSRSRHGCSSYGWRTKGRR